MRSLPLLLLGAGCAAPPLPAQGEDAHGLVLLIHGSKDDPSVWASGLGEELAALLEAPEEWDIVAYDWAEEADNRATAAKKGRRIGRRLAALLEEEYDYAEVHAIGHSAGAHVAAALVDELEGPLEQLTLLDPFGGLGLVRWGYGRRRFGEGAAFTDAYLNIGDGVPSTEDLPQNACGFDVTGEAPDGYPEDEAHWWPIDFYQGSAGSGIGLDLALPLGGDDRWAACSAPK